MNYLFNIDPMFTKFLEKYQNMKRGLKLVKFQQTEFGYRIIVNVWPDGYSLFF
jgi:hypothetical protein